MGAVSTGCADEEREVQQLDAELHQLAARLADVRSAGRAAAERASEARDRAMRALEVRESVRATREGGGRAPDDGSPLRALSLQFASDEGREAFDAFRRGELDAAGLRARLTDLEERSVIDQIEREGRRLRRTDRRLPWPEEQEAVRQAIAAREALRSHQRAAEAAQIEIERLTDRERDLLERLADARRRLEECRRG